MDWLVLFVLVISSHVVCADINDATTRIYDLEVPGADPIRIIEGESLWDKDKSLSKFEHRAINSYTTDTSQTNINVPTNLEDEDENAEFAPVALHEFLSSYASKLKKNQTDETSMESVDLITKPPEIGESFNEKSKSWNLMHYQKHNHPYEDKKGWVTLDPVPWSVSKIAKWQSNAQPSHKPWNDYGTNNENPWENEFNSDGNSGFNIRPSSDYEFVKKPNYEIEVKPNNPYNIPSNLYDKYYNKKQEIKPLFSKPSAVYSQKVHVHQGYTEIHKKNPIKVNGYFKENDPDCKEDDKDDIITDGQPPNFPTGARESIRRRGSEIHPETHPSNGDGEWVLLSTTKGYKYPKTRQRSLEFSPQSISSHRAVRLTVLPPLKGSKVNMTTSHGGLLQVESTFETVDQSQKKYAKKQNQKIKKRPNKRPQKSQTKRKKLAQQVLVPTVATIPRRTTGPDTSAVLAAVGAGMIPATMAMLVPMAMNGRRKRDTKYATSNPYSSIEITLPRNI